MHSEKERKAQRKFPPSLRSSLDLAPQIEICKTGEVNPRRQTWLVGM